MSRNLSHRVEVVAPVSARAARERLWEILDLSLRDQRQAWILDGEARYTQLRPSADLRGSAALGAQATLIDLTRRDSSLAEPTG